MSVPSECVLEVRPTMLFNQTHNRCCYRQSEWTGGPTPILDDHPVHLLVLGTGSLYNTAFLFSFCFTGWC